MDLFKGRLQASEGSFHKKEQEYALQQLRKKLVKEGKLSAEVLLEVKQQGQRTTTLRDTNNLHNVLPSILQQETRVAEPNAMEIARARGLMPPITGDKRTSRADRWLQNSVGKQTPLMREHTVERSKGYVPKSVKINRWDMYREMARLKDFEGMGFAPVEVTRAETAAAKAQRLAAQRVMFASYRAFGYGTAAAVVGGIVGVRLGLWWADIYSTDDMRVAMKRLVLPMKTSMHEYFEPYSDWAKDEGGAFKEDQGVKNGMRGMKSFMRAHLGLDNYMVPMNPPPSRRN